MRRMAIVLVRAVNGQATPGDVVLALGLAAQLNGAIATVVSLGNYLAQVLTSASRFRSAGSTRFSTLTGSSPGSASSAARIVKSA